jgi:hypothetical protein
VHPQRAATPRSRAYPERWGRAITSGSVAGVVWTHENKDHAYINSFAFGWAIFVFIEQGGSGVLRAVGSFGHTQCKTA